MQTLELLLFEVWKIPVWETFAEVDIRLLTSKLPLLQATFFVIGEIIIKFIYLSQITYILQIFRFE